MNQSLIHYRPLFCSIVTYLWSFCHMSYTRQVHRLDLILSLCCDGVNRRIVRFSVFEWSDVCSFFLCLECSFNSYAARILIPTLSMPRVPCATRLSTIRFLTPVTFVLSLTFIFGTCLTLRHKIIMAMTKTNITLKAT